MTEEHSEIHIEQQNLFNEPKAPDIEDSDTQSIAEAQMSARKKELAQNTQNTQLALNKQLDTLPSTLRSAAETAMSLRNAQTNLINIATSEAYVASITAADPHALPELISAVSAAVATSDNLLIQMGKIAEKNASMNRVFEIMTQQKQANSSSSEATQKDTKYESELDRIKKAIYNKLDERRNAEGRHTSDLYKNPEPDDEVIDAEVLEHNSEETD